MVPDKGRPLDTIFGGLEAKRHAYRAPRKGVGDLMPLDLELNLPVGRFSFGLQRRAALEIARSSFADAREAIKRQTGGGAYARGRTVTVHADLPNAGAFDRWVGDVSDLDDPTSATTNLKMPAKYVSIRATYRN